MVSRCRLGDDCRDCARAEGIVPLRSRVCVGGALGNPLPRQPPANPGSFRARTDTAHAGARSRGPGRMGTVPNRRTAVCGCLGARSSDRPAARRGRECARHTRRPPSQRILHVASRGNLVALNRASVKHLARTHVSRRPKLIVEVTGRCTNDPLDECDLYGAAISATTGVAFRAIDFFPQMAPPVWKTIAMSERGSSKPYLPVLLRGQLLFPPNPLGH